MEFTVGNKTNPSFTITPQSVTLSDRTAELVGYGILSIQYPGSVNDMTYDSSTNLLKKEGSGKWNSGILKITLDSWDKFHDVTAKLLDLGDFIWRGQRCDWSLKSKFDRIVNYDREKKLDEVHFILLW